MSDEREAVLAELNHPDPLQSVLAAVWLTHRAQEDLIAYKIFLEAGIEDARCTTQRIQ